MNTFMKDDRDELGESVDGAELTEEEVEHVVGGLGRGWWPDPSEPIAPMD